LDAIEKKLAKLDTIEKRLGKIETGMSVIVDHMEAQTTASQAHVAALRAQFPRGTLRIAVHV
jgi:hypothetical protein